MAEVTRCVDEMMRTRHAVVCRSNIAIAVTELGRLLIQLSQDGIALRKIASMNDIWRQAVGVGDSTFVVRLLPACDRGGIPSLTTLFATIFLFCLWCCLSKLLED